MRSLLYALTVLSLPMRGAWIEIISRHLRMQSSRRRSPCGERGLKSLRRENISAITGRSPCGERGLKSALSAQFIEDNPRRSPCGERGLKFSA